MTCDLPIRIIDEALKKHMRIIELLGVKELCSCGIVCVVHQSPAFTPNGEFQSIRSNRVVSLPTVPCRGADYLRIDIVERVRAYHMA